MSDLLADVTHEFRLYKSQAERAMASLADAAFFQRPGEAVNPIALVVKHVAGNLTSRWSDFLTSDGDKPARDRDSEFVLGEQDTRASLMERWEAGWQTLLDTLASLGEGDLAKTITIRGEPHTVQQAIVRSLGHTAYHVGQILYIARLLNPTATWLTIAPGASRSFRPAYRSS